jgi:GNAT superfamily N-acetyltransferase
LSRLTTGPAGPGRYALRPAAADDAPAIVDLLNDVYGHWGDLAYWRWKYLDPPAPFRSPSAVAELDGQIVGHFGILPVEALWNGRPIRAGQTIDAAVLPAFRRQGIHSALGRLVLGAAAQADYSLIYAFPGLYSLNVDLRIGYRPVAFVPEMVQLLAPRQVLIRALARLPGDLVALWRWRRNPHWSPETVRRLARLRRSLLLVPGFLGDPVLPQRPAATSFDVRSSGRFDSAFDNFWRRNRPPTGLSLVKDSRYLGWRYGDHPDQRYQRLALFSSGRLLGFAILAHRPPYSQLCELLVERDRDDVLDALVAAAGQQARQEGSLVLITWARPAQHRLRRLGFISYRRLHQLAHRWPALAGRFYQVIAYADHLRPAQRQALLLAAERWSPALGDSDLA